MSRRNSISTYGSNGTFVGIPGGHRTDERFWRAHPGCGHRRAVGSSLGGESGMLISAILGGIAGYLGGDAVDSSIQEFYRSDEGRSLAKFRANQAGNLRLLAGPESWGRSRDSC